MIDREKEAEYAQSIFGALRAHTADEIIGVTRLGYTAKEDVAHAIVSEYALAFDLHVDNDQAGNLVIRHRGIEYGPQKRITVGSHLDSVQQGGNYDGAAGVVAGLLLMRRLRDRGSLLPVETVAFRCEESATFGKCYIGSSIALGKLDPEDLDRDQTFRRAASLSQVLDARQGGWRAIDAIKNRRPLWDVLPTAFYEVHIEQGPTLDDMYVPVAVVDAICGNVREKIRIIGEAGHSGATPMHFRRDPVVAAAQLINKLTSVANLNDTHRFTVGKLSTDFAGAVSRIAAWVELTLEWRAAEDQFLDAFGLYVAEEKSLVVSRNGCKIELLDHVETPAVDLPWELRRKLGDGKLLEITSGAGHDAAVFAKAGIPTGMLFVRNEGGSHCPEESMKIEDLLVAVDVLEKALLDA